MDLITQIWERATTTQEPPSGEVVLLTAGVALVCLLVPTLWHLTRHVLTIVHESAHATVAVLTGRRLAGVRLHSDTSGLTLSVGKPRGPGMIAMAFAGYTGPAVLGLAAAWVLGRGYAVGLLWLLVNRTKMGKAVLAASMNPRGVTLLGLELTNIYIVVWAIYGILAGIAGVLLGMFLGVSSYSVGPLTASAFSIVVLGGLGSVSGSLIAAYVVGYLETLTAYLINPAYRTIPALLLLIAVMYIRPQGLLGRR